MRLNKSYSFCLLLFIPISFVLFSFTDGKKKKTDVEDEGLKGKVKSVRVYRYYSIDDKTFSINHLTMSKTDSSYHLKVNYDEKGNLLGWEGNKGEKLLTITFNKSGYRYTATKFNTDGIRTYLDSFFYDTKGNMIEDKGFAYRGDTLLLACKNKYEFDSKGNMTKMFSYASTNEIGDKWLYKYDANGNQTEQTEYSPKGIFLQKRIYKYDDKGNVSETSFYGDSLIFKNVYKYNDKGFVIEELHYSSDKIIDQHYFYKYEYDEKGNVIKKICPDNLEQTPLTIRVIEYY